MRLHEYQAKTILARYGVPVPKGYVTYTAKSVKHMAQELGGDVVVKAQVAVDGRGKAGGIRLAKNDQDAEEVASYVFGMTIKGLPVRKILVEEMIRREKNYFIAILYDQAKNKPVFLASADRSANIERVLQEISGSVYTTEIDPLMGFHSYQAREAAIFIDLPQEYWLAFAHITEAVWKVFNDLDASYLEVSPLTITPQRDFLALDAKLIIDDDALYRQPELSELQELDLEADFVQRARQQGVYCTEFLEGRVGCLVNGGGISLLVMDLLAERGEKISSLLDLSKTITPRRLRISLNILCQNPLVEVLFINLYLHDESCVEILKSLSEIVEELSPRFPIVLRFAGKDAEDICQQENVTRIKQVSDISEGIQVVLDLLGESA